MNQNERRTRSTAGRTPQSRPPQARRRKKKKKNILPAIVIGIIGVVIIALIIMGLKTIFSAPKDESVTESQLEASASPEATATPEPSGTPAPSPAKEADISGEDINNDISGMVFVGGNGYGFYKFDNDITTDFIGNLNSAYTALDSGTDMYEILVPSAIDIMLPLSFLNDYADETSDQAKASSYIYGSLNTGIKTVPVYDEFKAHCDEKLYFSTDYHWTGLAAYYAYSQWAYTKGIEALPLSSFTKETSENFTGYYYLYSGLERVNYGETLEYYVPKMDMSYQYSDNNDGSDLTDGELFVNIIDDYAEAKFNTFLGGSHSYSIITNNDVKDDSACVLVVDSNGMALAPYIATNYSKTYVIDYRTYSGSVSSVAKETGAKDVIWCTSITATASSDYTAAMGTVK